MYALALSLIFLGAQLAMPEVYANRMYFKTYVLEQRDPTDWDWEGRSISLYDGEGWKYWDYRAMDWKNKRVINPSLVCFGQGKKRRVICGELGGMMEF
jgi:hypothetical protein